MFASLAKRPGNALLKKANKSRVQVEVSKTPALTPSLSPWERVNHLAALDQNRVTGLMKTTAALKRNKRQNIMQIAERKTG
jgi:hypothetical protein